jgi:hypothetical protein
VALPSQLLGEPAGGFGGPAQRRHGISADVGLDQREECLPNGRVPVDDAFAASAGPADASQRDLSGVEFPHSDRHSGLTNTGGAGDCSDPAVAEGLGLRPYQQATLSLVDVRQNRLELSCQHGPLPIQPAHARPTNRRTESHESMICTP